jgi:hypothetical protein
VLKAGDPFFLAQPTGDVPLSDTDGFGLYYHDCRFLNGYELRLGGRPPQALGVDASRGCQASFWLTNPDLSSGDGVMCRLRAGVRRARHVA